MSIPNCILVSWGERAKNWQKTGREEHEFREDFEHTSWGVPQGRSGVRGRQMRVAGY